MPTHSRRSVKVDRYFYLFFCSTVYQNGKNREKWKNGLLDYLRLPGPVSTIKRLASAVCTRDWLIGDTGRRIRRYKEKCFDQRSETKQDWALWFSPKLRSVGNSTSQTPFGHQYRRSMSCNNQHCAMYWNHGEPKVEIFVTSPNTSSIRIYYRLSDELITITVFLFFISNADWSYAAKGLFRGSAVLAHLHGGVEMLQGR